MDHALPLCRRPKPHRRYQGVLRQKGEERMLQQKKYFLLFYYKRLGLLVSDRTTQTLDAKQLRVSQSYARRTAEGRRWTDRRADGQTGRYLNGLGLVVNCTHTRATMEGRKSQNYSSLWTCIHYNQRTIRLLSFGTAFGRLFSVLLYVFNSMFNS